MSDIRKYVELLESSEVNITFLNKLADMYIYDLDRSIVRHIKDDEKNGSNNAKLHLSTPYAGFSNSNKVSMFLSKNKVPDADKIIDGLDWLTFVYNPVPYNFDDNGTSATAAGTYNPSTNEITFYHSKYIDDHNVIVHELRHAIQYYTYENRRAKRKSEKNTPYREKPIELDAYWNETIASEIRDLVNLPYSHESEKLKRLIKRLFDKFNNTMGGLSPKNKKHYYRKTAKAVLALSMYHENGSNKDIKDILSGLDEIQTITNKMIHDLLDNDGSDEDLRKVLRIKDADLNSIPNYDADEEIVTDIPIPDRISVDMSDFDIGSALLYFAVKDLEDMAMKFKKILYKHGKDAHNIIHDFIVTHIADEDNQTAMLVFLVDYYDL